MNRFSLPSFVLFAAVVSAMLVSAVTASASTVECDDNGENCIVIYADVEVEASHEDSFGSAWKPPLQDKMQDRWSYTAQDGDIRGATKVIPKLAGDMTWKGYLQVPGCTPAAAAADAERALEDFLAELADAYGFDLGAGIAYVYPDGPRPCIQTFYLELNFYNN